MSSRDSTVIYVSDAAEPDPDSSEVTTSSDEAVAKGSGWSGKSVVGGAAVVADAC